MEYRDDGMPYKKKAKPKPVNKSKHKHVYKPCVFEYPEDWYQKEHLRSGKRKLEIHMYCTICGKRSFIDDIDRWYQQEKAGDIPYLAFRRVPTPECERELDPATRTLPTFYSDNVFVKYFVLPDEMKV